jgi:hypothetical protein
MDAEQVARNNALFRAANEGIRGAAERYRVEELVPFLCECADEQCTQLVRLSLVEYHAVCAHSTRFIIAPGHAAAEGETTMIVGEHGDYLVVEKQGPAAGLVTDCRPRDQGKA